MRSLVSGVGHVRAVTYALVPPKRSELFPSAVREKKPLGTHADPCTHFSYFKEGVLKPLPEVILILRNSLLSFPK